VHDCVLPSDHPAAVVPVMQDSINRRYSLMFLLDFAHTYSDRQFLFLTPQASLVCVWHPGWLTQKGVFISCLVDYFHLCGTVTSAAGLPPCALWWLMCCWAEEPVQTKAT